MNTPANRLARDAGALVLASALGLLVFRLAPAIDIAVSRFFHDATLCGDLIKDVFCSSFPAESTGWLMTLREIGLRIPQILFALVSIHLIYLLFFPASLTYLRLKRHMVAIISFLLGPVVLVNLVLKSHWGRPRPYQTDQFGGDAPYVLPGTWTDHCDTNCSFVSGEASAAFWMFALVLLLPQRHRRKAAAVIAVFALFFSMLRVAFGRHYVSDVSMAALFTLTLIAFTRWVLSLGVVRRGLERFIVTIQGLELLRKSRWPGI
jgi:membrane-associated phospholipid phosphatase